jgi:hypothetical protein
MPKSDELANIIFEGKWSRVVAAQALCTKRRKFYEIIHTKRLCVHGYNIQIVWLRLHSSIRKIIPEGSAPVLH